MYLLKGEKKLVGKYMYLPKIEKTSRKNVCTFLRLRKLVGKMYVPS